MDLVSIIALIGICTGIGTVTGFGLGAVFGRNTAEPEPVENLIKERDEWEKVANKYKKIASSHDINYIKPPGNGWKFVEELQYDSTIEDNLNRLKEDLSSLGLKKIKIKIQVYVIGAWAKWLAGERNRWTEDRHRYTDAPNWAFKTPGEFDEFGKLRQTFMGCSPDEVVDEFKKFLENPYWGLFVGGCPGKNGRRWNWARPNDSLRFKVSVSTPGKPKLFKPDVKIVEVAVSEPGDDLRAKAEAEVNAWLLKNKKKKLVGN